MRTFSCALLVAVFVCGTCQLGADVRRRVVASTTFMGQDPFAGTPLGTVVLDQLGTASVITLELEERFDYLLLGDLAHLAELLLRDSALVLIRTSQTPRKVEVALPGTTLRIDFVGAPGLDARAQEVYYLLPTSKGVYALSPASLMGGVVVEKPSARENHFVVNVDR